MLNFSIQAKEGLGFPPEEEEGQHIHLNSRAKSFYYNTHSLKSLDYDLDFY